MTGLLDDCGQGGIADAAHQEAYDSSFLVADPAAGLRARDGGHGLRGRARSPPAPPSPTASPSAPSGHAPRPAWPRATTSAASATPPSRHGYADVRLAASRRFLASTASGGLTPAATAAHLRDHGSGPWGAPGTAARSSRRRPGRAGLQRRQRLHARPRPQRDGRVHDRRASRRPGRGCAAARLRGAGQPVRQHLRARPSPRTPAGPPPFVPFELSGEELWHAADALRRRVEADPDALSPAPQETLDPVEDELWAEADDVLEHPARWAEVGASWGSRALDALRSCIP